MLIVFLTIWLVSILITINLIDTSDWQGNIGEMVCMIFLGGPLMLIALLMWRDNESAKERRRLRSRNAAEETKYLLEEFDNFIVPAKKTRKTTTRRTRRNVE